MFTGAPCQPLTTHIKGNVQHKRRSGQSQELVLPTQCLDNHALWHDHHVFHLCVLSLFVSFALHFRRIRCRSTSGRAWYLALHRRIHSRASAMEQSERAVRQEDDDLGAGLHLHVFHGGDSDGKGFTGESRSGKDRHFRSSPVYLADHFYHTILRGSLCIESGDHRWRWIVRHV